MDFEDHFLSELVLISFYPDILSEYAPPSNSYLDHFHRGYLSDHEISLESRQRQVSKSFSRKSLGMQIIRKLSGLVSTYFDPDILSEYAPPPNSYLDHFHLFG